MIKFKFLPILILGVVISTSGCVTNMAVKLAESFMPKYDEVERQWPALSEGEGRVVVYYPKLSAKDRTLGGRNNLRILIDGEKYDLVDDTFIFLELPAGEYTMEYYKKDRTIDFAVVENETVYLRANETGGILKMNVIAPRGVIPSKTHAPEIVSEDDARSDLLGRNYVYMLMDPIAVNKNFKK